MKEVLNIAGPISLIITFVCIVGAAVSYWLALQVSQGREQVRQLKTAFERDPTPGDYAKALRLWPSAATLPQKLQRDEIKRLASNDELKRAQRFESGKALSRFFLIITFFALVIYIVSRVWHPA